MASGEDKREAILTFFETTLNAITAGNRPTGATVGDTFVYSPDKVRRIDGLGERLLDTNFDVLYFVAAGDETNEEAESESYNAQWEVFIIGFKKFEEVEDPYYQEKVRQTFQNDIVHDIKLAIAFDTTVDGEVDNVNFADLRVDVGEFRSWAFVEVRLMIEYNWRKDEP